MEKNDNYKLEIKEKLKSVNLSDGVNKDEAIVLAQNYLIEAKKDKILDIRKIRLVDNKKHKYGKQYWLVSFSTTREAYKNSGGSFYGLKWGSILVNKKTGEVKYLGEGPS